MLNRKTKQRLNQLSLVISSTEEVYDNMNDINNEYLKDLNTIINLCKGIDTSIITSTETTIAAQTPEMDLSGFYNFMHEDKKEEGAKQQSGPQTLRDPEPPKEDKPDWVKTLWRKIMIKCHPDKLSFDTMSAQEIYRRQTYLEKAKKAIEDKNWPEMLYIGVRLEEYIDDLNGKNQIDMLNDHYSNITKNINKIQSTIAWTWGANWDNPDYKIRMIKNLLKINNLPEVEDKKILEYILKIEEE